MISRTKLSLWMIVACDKIKFKDSPEAKIPTIFWGYSQAMYSHWCRVGLFLPDASWLAMQYKLHVIVSYKNFQRRNWKTFAVTSSFKFRQGGSRIFLR